LSPHHNDTTMSRPDWDGNQTRTSLFGVVEGLNALILISAKICFLV